MAQCENCGKENAKLITMKWTVERPSLTAPKAFCNYKCERGDKPQEQKMDEVS